MEHIYKLVDPRDDSPFYVGITCHPNTRFQQHLTTHIATNRVKRSRILEIYLAGLLPRMEIIEIVEDRETAKQREVFWILEYLTQGYALTNMQHNENALWDETEEVEARPPLPVSTPVKKAVGWLQHFEMDEAWEYYLAGREPNEMLMRDFVSSFTSPRLPALRERDLSNLKIWHDTTLWKLYNPGVCPFNF